MKHLCIEVFTSLNNHPFITPQNFPNSSSILNLKKYISFQTYSFKSPNDHHHLHMTFINMHPNNLVDFAPCLAFWCVTNFLRKLKHNDNRGWINILVTHHHVMQVIMAHFKQMLEFQRSLTCFYILSTWIWFLIPRCHYCNLWLLQFHSLMKTS